MERVTHLKESSSKRATQLTEAGMLNQSAKMLALKTWGPDFDPLPANSHKKLDVVAHAFNPNTQKTDASQVHTKQAALLI